MEHHNARVGSMLGECNLAKHVVSRAPRSLHTSNWVRGQQVQPSMALLANFTTTPDSFPSTSLNTWASYKAPPVTSTNRAKLGRLASVPLANTSPMALRRRG